MSRLAVVDPAHHPYIARVASGIVIGEIIVGLWVLLPIRMLVILAIGVILSATVVGALRRASRQVDTILREELPPHTKRHDAQ